MARDSEGRKICPRCGSYGPFTSDKGRKDGLAPLCRVCQRVADRARYRRGCGVEEGDVTAYENDDFDVTFAEIGQAIGYSHWGTRKACARTVRRLWQDRSLRERWIWLNSVGALKGLEDPR